MSDIRKHKWLIHILTVLVLLSFLHSAPVFAQISAELVPGYDAVGKVAEAGFTEAAVVGAEEAGNLRPATISAGDDSQARGTDSISLARKATEDLVTREQKQSQTRTLLMRFLAVVFALILAVRVTYRILIRRYGCHMIAVWQNITYIHQMDGKKGERFSVYIG